MKMGPLFPKKEKKDVDQQIMEVGVRLRGLERKIPDTDRDGSKKNPRGQEEKER